MRENAKYHTFLNLIQTPFGSNFWNIFQFPGIISTSTCRMTIIFLPTYSLMLGECFRYLQRVLKVLFDTSEALWSEKIGKKWWKVRNFELVQNQFWRLFLAPILRFLRYFHFYVSYDHTFFTYVFLDVRRVF